MNGAGKLVFADGRTYTGNFANGKRCGQGKMISSIKPGQKIQSYYDGNWAEDQYNGQGKKQYRDGRLYQGEFQKGIRQGKGKIVYAKRPDCPVQGWYEGEWSEGKFHGQGKEAYPDGRAYVGQFS